MSDKPIKYEDMTPKEKCDYLHYMGEKGARDKLKAKRINPRFYGKMKKSIYFQDN